MDRITALGRAFFAVAMVAFGIQHFMYAGFLAGLELLPRGIPAHAAVAYLTGAVLIVAGLSIAAGVRVRLSALILAAVFLLLALIRRGPEIPVILTDISRRTVLLETLSLCAGAMVLAYLAPPETGALSRWNVLAGKLALPGRYILAVSMFVFGIAHLQVAGFIASLIPSWMPARLFLAYFTGFAFFAAALAFGFGKFLRAAGVLLAAMFVLWVVLLHAPRVAGALHNPDEWNSLFVALAMSGCALFIAARPEAGRTESRSEDADLHAVSAREQRHRS
jgi:uncharacterized membrane protein YphA (DoxX/SURF4 family)